MSASPVKHNEKCNNMCEGVCVYVCVREREREMWVSECAMMRLKMVLLNTTRKTTDDKKQN